MLSEKISFSETKSLFTRKAGVQRQSNFWMDIFFTLQYTENAMGGGRGFFACLYIF